MQQGKAVGWHKLYSSQLARHLAGAPLRAVRHLEDSDLGFIHKIDKVVTLRAILPERRCARSPALTAALRCAVSLSPEPAAGLATDSARPRDMDLQGGCAAVGALSCQQADIHMAPTLASSLGTLL
jgi:hypothetical protein